MSRLRVVDARTIEKVVFSLGFERVRQKGSHIYYRHSDGRYTSIPYHRGRVLARPFILPTDFVDLYIVRVDPQNPTRYIVGDQTLEMEEEQIVIGLPEGESVRKTVYQTIYGPVITELEPGIEGAVALRSYGTLPEGEITDGTLASVLRFMEAKG